MTTISLRGNPKTRRCVTTHDSGLGEDGVFGRGQGLEGLGVGEGGHGLGARQSLHLIVVLREAVGKQHVTLKLLQGAYQFLKINLRPFLRHFKTNFFLI